MRVLDELEQVDVSVLSDDELHAHVVELERLSSQMAAWRAVALAEWDARRVWADDGSRTGWARLARECSLTATTAQAEVRRARKLRSMPATAARFTEGKLSVDQVDLLATARQPGIEELFARDEAMLIDDVVAPLRMRDATRMVAYWKQAAFDSVGKEPPHPNPGSRHLSGVRTLNGTVDVRGNLDVFGGTEWLNELASIEQELFEADWTAARAEHGPDALPSQLPRTATQRRADAQVQMARNSRACREGTYRQPRPLLTVHVGLGTLSRMCELADATVVSPNEVFPLVTAADVERAVFDGPARVIELGVRQRFFTGALRRAIEIRDRHCQHPSGCDVPAEECQIDHRIHYTDGGLTTQDNGRCECRTHNLQNERDRTRNQRPPPDDTS